MKIPPGAPGTVLSLKFKGHILKTNTNGWPGVDSSGSRGVPTGVHVRKTALFLVGTLPLSSCNRQFLQSAGNSCARDEHEPKLSKNVWLVRCRQTVDRATACARRRDARRTPIPASCSGRGASPPGANAVAWCRAGQRCWRRCLCMGVPRERARLARGKEATALKTFPACAGSPCTGIQHVASPVPPPLRPPPALCSPALVVRRCHPTHLQCPETHC